MAKSSSSMYLPTRSISLPTRLIHPKAQRVQEKLNNIQDLNSSPSTSSRIQLGLAKLVELYDFVNEQIICSPQGQQTLCLSHNAKLVEHALDESILLLDVTYATRDLIETFLEQIQELQSTLRRRGRSLSLSLSPRFTLTLTLARKSRTLRKDNFYPLEENKQRRNLKIISKKIVKDIDVQTMLGRLAMLNAGLEVINDELNYLSRRLIQHRVSLLNIVTS
ncbi:unnamed protein product [Cochlearia groenlandica]